MRKVSAFFISLSLFFFVSHSQCINSFPYLEDFEATDGTWVSGGSGNDWAWGNVSKSVISQAASGNNCWVTGGLTNSFYNFGERSFVQSPCFDFTSLQNPVVSFSLFWESEKTYDGTTFQYSTDGGSTWQNVGNANSPSDCINQNWFNTSSITNLTGLTTVKTGWAGNIQPTIGNCQGGNGSNGWKKAQHCVDFLAGAQSVIFRFAFGAGTQCNDFDGFGFDDFNIFEESPLLADFNYSCLGNTYAFSGSSSSCPSNFNWNFSDGSFATGVTTTHVFSSSMGNSATFTVSGNCHQPVSVTKPLQTFTFAISSIDPNCAGGSDGKAFVSPMGATTFSYSWNTNPTQFSDTAFNLKSGLYSVVISAPNYCDVTASIFVDEPAPLSPFATVQSDTCPGGVGKISINTNGGTRPYVYSWSSNLSIDSALTNVFAGDYSFTITDAHNCSVTELTSVPLTSGIALKFDTIKNISCYEQSDGSLTLRVSGGKQPLIYQWSNNSGTPSIQQLAPGIYTVTVTDANQCTESDSVTLVKDFCPSYIYFPTGFSPNGDGVNDFFKPTYSADLDHFQIQIYNRWGELLFESNQANEGWNGYARNVAQPMSTYVWMAEYSYRGGKKISAAGNITLVR